MNKVKKIKKSKWITINKDFKLLDLLKDFDVNNQSDNNLFEDEKFIKKSSDINVDEKFAEHDKQINKHNSDIESHEKILQKLIEDTQKVNEQTTKTNNQVNQTNKSIQNTRKEIKETKKQMLAVKDWIKLLVTVFVLVFLWWCYETFVRFDNVKQDYIEQTKENQKQLELFKSNMDTLNEKQNRQDKYIEKEVERQVYEKMLKYIDSEVQRQLKNTK